MEYTPTTQYVRFGALALLIFGIVAVANAQEAQTPQFPNMGTGSTTSATTTSTTSASTTSLVPYIATTTSAVPSGLYLTLTPTSGGVGSHVGLQGGGFEANEPVTIDIAGVTSSAVTDAQGNFSATIAIPQNAIGNAPITATGNYSGRMSQSVFTTTASTSTSTNQTTGAASSTIITAPLATTTPQPAGIFTSSPTFPLGVGASTTNTAAPIASTSSTTTTSVPTPQIVTPNIPVIAWPPLLPVRPAVLEVGADGSVLLRGTVVGVDSGSNMLTVRSWGGDWQVTLAQTSTIDPNGFTAIAPGDYIGLNGLVTAGNQSIMATYIRDWTKTQL